MLRKSSGVPLRQAVARAARHVAGATWVRFMALKRLARGDLVLERTVICPACSGGCVVRDENGSIAAILTGDGAEDRAQELLKPGQRIVRCATCGGTHEVMATLLVARRSRAGRWFIASGP